MAKEEKEKKKKDTVSTKERKERIKKARKAEQEAIKQEKIKVEEKIDSLIAERKTTKDKTKKKEISSKIKELKKQRKNIGKQDTYFSDIMAEMRLVRWPTRKEMLKYSIASLAFVLFFALFFYGIDALFALVKDLIS